VEYALIDYDNGVWKAQGLDDFEFRSEERGTDGPPLDRLRGRVQLAAREKHQTDKIVSSGTSSPTTHIATTGAYWRSIMSEAS
jgi:hypothetical protein